MVISREVAGILTSYLALFKKEQIIKTFKHKIKNAKPNPRPNLEPDIEFRIPSNGWAMSLTLTLNLDLIQITL